MLDYKQFDSKVQKSLEKLSTKGKDGKPVYLFVVFDHRTAHGPLYGLQDMGQIKSLVNQSAGKGATGIVTHVGIIRALNRLYDEKVPIPTVTHLEGQSKQYGKITDQEYKRTLLTNVEEAFLVASPGISMHAYIGSDKEAEHLDMFRKVKKERIKCFYRYGEAPALMMMAFPPKDKNGEYDFDTLKLACAVGSDVGADLIKTFYWSKEPDKFKEVVRSSSVPVLIAGGPKIKDEKKGPIEVLEWCEGTRDAGGRGISIGRNIYQQKPLERGPGIMVSAIHKIFVDGMSAKEAAEESGLTKLLKES